MNNKDKVYQAIDTIIKRQEDMLEQQGEAERALLNDLRIEVAKELANLLNIELEDILQDWIAIKDSAKSIESSRYNRRHLVVLNLPECITIYFYIHSFVCRASPPDSLSSLDREKILLTGWHINYGAWHNPGLYFDTFAEALYKAKKLYNPNIDGKGDLDND